MKQSSMFQESKFDTKMSSTFDLEAEVIRHLRSDKIEFRSKLRESKQDVQLVD